MTDSRPPASTETAQPMSGGVSAPAGPLRAGSGPSVPVLGEPWIAEVRRALAAADEHPEYDRAEYVAGGLVLFVRRWEARAVAEERARGDREAGWADDLAAGWDRERQAAKRIGMALTNASAVAGERGVIADWLRRRAFDKALSPETVAVLNAAADRIEKGAV